MASVRDFGARGDGRTDDTAALAHAVQHGDGSLVFPRGDYLLSEPLVVPLDLFGRLSIAGEGGVAKLIMTGPGPALHLVGTPPHRAPGALHGSNLATRADADGPRARN